MKVSSSLKMRKRPSWPIIMFAGIEARGYAMKAMANSQNLYSVGTMDGPMRWMESSLERLT